MKMARVAGRMLKRSRPNAFVALGVAVFVLTVGIQLGSAQPRPVTADWESVEQLTPGSNIRVETSEKAVVRGRFQSATDNSVAVSTKNGQKTVARQSVVRLSVKGESHRSRNMLIGLGIGAGVGVGAGAIADAHCTAGSCFVSPNLGKLVLGLVGGIIGAGVGGVLPTGWRNIYRMPVPTA